MIKRHIQSKIYKWIQDGNNALLVTGARQVGKTYVIRNSLKKNNINYMEFNFIEQPELVELFKNSTDTKDFLMRLSLAADKPLSKGMIIFFDEIQEVKDFITKIKFLVDDGTYKYVLSGSLLGVELNGLKSAPVGYMQILDMYPLDFHEFVDALGVQENIIAILEKCFIERKTVDEFIHKKMLDIFNLYLIVGGMPQAVSIYLETNDLNRVSQVQQDITRLYRFDFSKYEEKYKLKLKEIYDALPGQLDEKNKRFQLNKVGKGISFKKVENDFLWLKDAGVVIPVYNVSEPKLPLMISENRNLFKLFMSDVGLLTNMYSDYVKMAILNHESSINNGALFENVVAQELNTKGFNVYYYNSKKMGELDFVVELDGEILPLEIKSGKDYKRHSALNNVLSTENYNIKKALVFSQGNVEVKDKRIYLPIYMIMFLKNKKLNNSVYKIDLNGLCD
ncbi:AAA family ATPase [uncultured Holdemanella sp.]|uniref:ATP-binding protein n=1 Tax=uncultured Holdemanella sp. TaxID=1763549 RepID=UPI0025F67A3C|nr:AAA family ATPase [uncultured Holdemanella sp.]